MEGNFNEMDVNIFNDYMYKTNDEGNVDVSLSTVSQFGINQQQQHHQQASSSATTGNSSYHEMADQTPSFHTPSFGDEEFDDIPLLHEPAQYQMQASHEINMTDTFNWHTTSDSHMMSNQSYQMPAAASAVATNQQPTTAYLTNADQLSMMFSGTNNNPLLQPQISPQMNVAGNNYMGQSVPAGMQGAAIIAKTTGSLNVDNDGLNDRSNAFSHPSSDPFVSGGAGDTAVKENETGKKLRAVAKKTTGVGNAGAAAKKRKDPNEPQKPVSAYALFFKDNQSAIKEQNRSASFGDISKIVASLWDALAVDNKNVYKKKAEEAKKDYARALAAYQANLTSLPSPADVKVTANPVTSSVIIDQQQLVIQQPQINHISPQHQQQQQIVNQNYQNYLQVPPAVAVPTFANQVAINQQQQINQNMIGNQTTSNLMNPTQQQQLHVTGQQQAQQQQNQFMNQQQMQVTSQMPPQQMQSAATMGSVLTCIRNGCTNLAIVSSDWEDEYCSNECVITHCRDVFSNWIHTQSSGLQSYVA